MVFAILISYFFVRFDSTQSCAAACSLRATKHSFIFMKQDTPQDLSFFENFKYQVVRKVVHAFNLHVQGEISQTKLNSREVETLPKSDVHQLGEQ